MLSGFFSRKLSVKNGRFDRFRANDVRADSFDAHTLPSRSEHRSGCEMEGVSGGFAAASHRAAGHQPVRDVEEELGPKLSRVRNV